MALQFMDTLVIGELGNVLTINGNFAKAEVLLRGLTDRNSGGPPGSPAENSSYIVDVATGAWAGYSVGWVAYYYAGLWDAFVPREGMTFWVNDENVNYTWDGASWVQSAGGTVTTVSVVSANGLAGSVADASSTPAITLSTTVTGLLKGNGTAISAASAGTDYESPISTGTTAQYFRGDKSWQTLSSTAVAHPNIIGSPTDATTVQRLIDHVGSAGVMDGAILTNNGDGTVGLGQANALLRRAVPATITRSGSTATVTAVAHGYAVGDTVLIRGATQSEYNGLFTVLTVPTTGEFTYAVTGTPATPATGSIYSSSEHSPLITCVVPAQTPISLTDNTTNYILATYNNGVPQYEVTTDLLSFNCLDRCLVYTVVRVGTTLSIIDGRAMNVDGNRKERRRLLTTRKFDHVLGGTVIGAAGTRNISVTSGEFWYGLTPVQHDSFDTSGTSTFTYYYRDGVGGWTTQAGQTQINNTQYDDGDGTLGTLSNNSYGVHWVYLLVDTPTTLAVQFGQGDYATLAAAQAATVPSGPPAITGVGALIGRIIIQKSSTSFTEIASAFSQTFAGASATTHNGLAGIQGGTTGEYYHLTSAVYTPLAAGEHALLTGRAGGQTLYGGTSSGNNLKLYSTSNATKGQIILFDKVFCDETSGFVSIGDPTGARYIGGVLSTAAFSSSLDNGLPYSGEYVALRAENTIANVGTQWAGLRSRGSLSAPTIVQNGDTLMILVGCGYDGVDYAQAGYAKLAVAGTPGSGDMPGVWDFGTSSDGGEVPISRMTISEYGVGIGQAVFGASAEKVLAIGSGTAPSTSPSDAVQLYSADYAAGDTRLYVRSETGGILSFGNGTIAASGSITISPASGSGVNISLATTGDFAVNTNQLFVDTSASKVGIGTATPAFKLDVVDSTAPPLRLLRNQAGSSINGIYIDQPDTTDGNSLAILYRTNTTGSGAATDVSFSGVVFAADIHDNSTREGSIRFNTAKGGVGYSEKLRITATGQLLLGTTVARTFATSGYTPQMQVEGTSGSLSSMSLIRNSNDTGTNGLLFGKTRGTTVGGTTIITAGDPLGVIDFAGSDGTNLISAARIAAISDGTPGTNDMPGHLSFYTTPDGSSSLSERVRIDSSGNLGLGQTSFGTSAAKVFAIGAGTAPSTSPADAVQLWCADNNGVAGKATLLMRNEIYAGTQTMVGAVYKTDTGDPATAYEGMLCINTFDNTFKVYADAAWRTLASGW